MEETHMAFEIISDVWPSVAPKYTNETFLKVTTSEKKTGVLLIETFKTTK